MKLKWMRNIQKDLKNFVKKKERESSETPESIKQSLV